ncbi:MAG: SAM-dependent chlorinase/fluorinase [Candidatus Kaiserbacteria bacterium]|nr:SAM-dependent chlorinase/fluorinase [Candidatus Kaiserbacteria bacterium]
MSRKLVCITDCVDVAYNELRGVVYSELQKLGTVSDLIIEPVVPVEAFSVINGNFILRLMGEVYPDGTVFLVILNPLKERPARLVGKTKKKGFYFVGANTGVFDWFTKDFGIEELYELHDPGFVPFGGKYVHAPSAVKIACGVNLATLGKPFDKQNLLQLDVQDGTIVHIDNFGLIKFTGILPELKENTQLKIDINGQFISAVYAQRMMSRETGEWVLYPGSSLGLPEVGKVRCNGAEEIRARVGEVIKISI